MGFATIFALALGLSMDATAVAVARGLSAQRLRARDALSVAVLFGGFQAAMPWLGYALGSFVGPWVARWTAWIAFVMLSALGGKMLHEAWSNADDDGSTPQDAFAPKVLFMLAIATSIDAFAVGVTLPLLHAPLATCLLTIGITTALLSSIGLYAGRRFGTLLGKRLDVLGGFILIGLGLKILLDHLSSS
jgi:putative Mn2+ efflux pump MntP